ncbi:MFS transporter [Shigella flexneri]
MQIPGGRPLDKFGSKKFIPIASFFWSLFTFLQGFVDVPAGLGRDLHVLYALYAGLLGSAIIPGERRIVAAWFPTKERGTASAIFNSAHISLALFSPLLGWLTFAWAGARLTVMGVIGFVLTALWIKLIHNPTDYPRMSAEELKFISKIARWSIWTTKSRAVRQQADPNCITSSNCSLTA